MRPMLREAHLYIYLRTAWCASFAFERPFLHRVKAVHLTAIAFDIVRVGEFSGVEVIVCRVRIACMFVGLVESRRRQVENGSDRGCTYTRDGRSSTMSRTCALSKKPTGKVANPITVEFHFFQSNVALV